MSADTSVGKTPDLGYWFLNTYEQASRYPLVPVAESVGIHVYDSRVHGRNHFTPTYLSIAQTADLPKGAKIQRRSPYQAYGFTGGQHDYDHPVVFIFGDEFKQKQVMSFSPRVTITPETDTDTLRIIIKDFSNSGLIFADNPNSPAGEFIARYGSAIARTASEYRVSTSELLAHFKSGDFGSLVGHLVRDMELNLGYDISPNKEIAYRQLFSYLKNHFPF